MRLGRLIAPWAGALGMFTALADCDRPATPGGAMSVVDSAGMHLTTVDFTPEAVPLWRLASRPQRVLTGAETGDSTALAVVGPVRWLADGSLIVADLGASRLLVYDSVGAFRRGLGRRGAGPGEFRDIASVSVLAGDTLTTFDASLRRLSLWHPTGGFVRQVDLRDGGALDAWPADAWLWHDSQVVVLQLGVTPRPELPTGATVRRWPMRAQLTLRDSSGRVLRTSPAFDGMYTGVYATGDTRLPFSHQPFVAVGADRIYFGSGAKFQLSYLTSAFVVSGEIRWPTQHESLTAEEVARVRDEAYTLMVRRVPPERAREALAMNFLPEILPADRPAIGRVLVGPDERVWIERFEALRLGSRVQTPGNRWTVLAPDGSPVARLLLPANTRLEAVRGNRVVVVQRDSLDIQTVAVYELLRP